MGSKQPVGDYTAVTNVREHKEDKHDYVNFNHKTSMFRFVQSEQRGLFAVVSGLWQTSHHKRFG